MKMRALLLTALLIGGAYAMLQSFNEYQQKKFSELVETTHSEFHTLVFSKPPMFGAPAETWVVDDEKEVNELLVFLQNYTIQKLKPEEIDPDDNIDELRITLQDRDGNSLTIVIAENMIIQNSELYYEIVDGPLDVDWIVRFIVSNKS
ncbi:hypothetical protein [Sporosarcina sp. ITBMC105]